MIVRGIVTLMEREQIRSVAKHHGLTEGIEGEFRTWTEEFEGESILWVEIDVNEGLSEYLERTGFFAAAEEEPARAIQCPHCENDNLEELELHVEHPCYTIHSLIREPDGVIAAQSEAEGRVFRSHVLGSKLFCRKCRALFPVSDIAIKELPIPNNPRIIHDSPPGGNAIRKTSSPHSSLTITKKGAQKP